MIDKSHKKNLKHLNTGAFRNMRCYFTRKWCLTYIFKCRYLDLYKSRLVSLFFSDHIVQKGIFYNLPLFSARGILAKHISISQLFSCKPKNPV
jgi:hypothetical protein